MIWLIALLLILPIPSSAQEQYLGQLQVPQPVTELFDTFQKIDINFSGIPIIDKAFQSLNRAVQDPEQAAGDLPGFFNGLNQWFENNVGVGLGEIARSVGDFAVWVLELIVKMLKAGISAIGS